MRLSPLQEIRTKTPITLPPCLQDIHSLCFIPRQEHADPSPSIAQDFPLIGKLPVLYAEKSSAAALKTKTLRVGVVFSGGQAPGGHNVVAGLYDALAKISPGMTLFGFLHGPGGIVKGVYTPLTKELIDSYRNLGGFDLLGSGRDKIETEQDLSLSLAVIRNMDLDAIVIIGGDDSNTNAAFLAEYLAKNHCGCSVIGIPKTIDGDLQNQYVSISFGFDSACRVFSEAIGNIAKDALSSKKYYHFIKLMGRSASHITLECALTTQVNLSLIGEEIAEKKLPLSALITHICDMICQRARQGKNYGVILVPEGLIEFIPEIRALLAELNILKHSAPSAGREDGLEGLTAASKKCFISLPQSVQQQLLLETDPHGNVQLSHIETEKLISSLVAQQLQQRRDAGAYQGKFSPLHHYLGYEGRSGMPTNFDAHYCYALGWGAAALCRDRKSGYMTFIDHLDKGIEQWTFGATPLASLMHSEMRKGKIKSVLKKYLVDTSSSIFQSFVLQRERWMFADEYLCPGPTQYFGPQEISFIPPKIIKK